MGFLDRLFGKKRARSETTTAEAPPCPHTALVPRWESVADMGNEDKITSYTCQGCNQSFTAAAGRALQETEAARIKQELGN